MTTHYLIVVKFMNTNAHIGRFPVLNHHLKVYICGYRNGIAIIDSDKTQICVRNTLHFIGSPIRQKGHSLFVNTDAVFDEIIEKTSRRIGSINESQWGIGGFMTNSASPKKWTSRKKKIHYSKKEAACVVILDAARKSSVILEAHRSQIPIASSVDSNAIFESCKRITYPIPANDPIQFVYLFRNSITKSVLNYCGAAFSKKIITTKPTTKEKAKL